MLRSCLGPVPALNCADFEKRAEPEPGGKFTYWCHRFNIERPPPCMEYRDGCFTEPENE